MQEKWINYYCDIAERTAALSSAKRLQVGCVIVKDNRILSIGYNGTPSGWDNCCEEYIDDDGGSSIYVTKKEVLHAEANALMKLCRSTESSEGATLFVTHEPCMDCSKLIYQAGISKVYYIHEYQAQKCGSGAHFLEKAGIDIKKRNVNGKT